MNICVLNGSPKGAYSITMQTVLYLQKRYPGHTFHFVNVGAKIRSLEKGMTETLAALRQADLILFSYNQTKTQVG